MAGQRVGSVRIKLRRPLLWTNGRTACRQRTNQATAAPAADQSCGSDPGNAPGYIAPIYSHDGPIRRGKR
eukprot:708673-Prorocentrum_minimum.AAC.1